MSDNVNNGVAIQNCVSGLHFLTGDKKVEDPVELKDGTFSRRYRYVLAKPITFEMKVCSPYLVDFDLASVEGESMTVGFPSGIADCFMKQFSVKPGTAVLTVRTTRREFTIRIEIAVMPAQAGGASASIYVAPVVVPPPPPPPPPPVPVAVAPPPP